MMMMKIRILLTVVVWRRVFCFEEKMMMMDGRRLLVIKKDTSSSTTNKLAWVAVHKAALWLTDLTVVNDVNGNVSKISYVVLALHRKRRRLIG